MHIIAVTNKIDLNMLICMMLTVEMLLWINRAAYCLLGK